MTDSALAPSLGLAFLAGMLSFLSPCVLPIVPGFLSFVSAVTWHESHDSARERERALIAAILFVAGFALVFVVLGAAAGAAGAALASYRALLSRVGGVVVVLLGLSVLGIVKIPWMQRGRQVTLIDRPVGVGGAVLVGMAFGLGWTPCIGPVLAAILMYAASIQGAAEGAILLLVYALGLGVPFVASAAGLGSALRVLGGTSRVARIANVTSGVMLLAVGGLMLTDQLAAIVAPALRWMAWPVQLQ